MLSCTFQKTGAWLCQSQMRDKFRIYVCHIKQCCALGNKETSEEGFEALATSVGEETDAAEFHESECAYFASEALKKTPYKDKTPVRQQLAYANKVLYGPLLETSAERRRWSVVEEDDISKQKSKRSTKTKQKPTMSKQPLLWKPENAHFLGIFPDHKPKYINKVHMHKVEIKHDQLKSSAFSNPVLDKYKRKMIIKKPVKDFVKFEKFMFNDIPGIKKQHMPSLNQERGPCVPSFTGGNASDGDKQVGGDGVIENKSSENTPTAYSSLDPKGGNDQEIQDSKSYTENSSLLSIDNTQFSSAPNIIDIEMIENFPLERTELPSILGKTDVNAHTNIVTIGMFDGGYKKLPSVSKILEATMPEADRKVLDRWKAKMITELGEEGFEEYRKGLFSKGKVLHDCIQSELQGTSPSLENMLSVQGSWTSLSPVLPKISDVSVLESRLVHPYLHYQGAVDCVASYKGMPVLIDWKTSTRPKLTLKSMFDNPLQVVAYLGALSYDTNYQLLHQVQSAMVVVAYDTGLPAHVHIMDREKCQEYWKMWCARLVQFWRQLEVKESP